MVHSSYIIVVSIMTYRSFESYLCWCDDTSKEQTDLCVICNKTQTIKMHEFTRKAQCPVHTQIGYILCCKFICLDCISSGWIAKAVNGGGITVSLPDK